MTPAAFLDRDGTINARKQAYITRPDDLELLPGAATGIRLLREAGYKAILATNQSAVARGLVDQAGMEAIHARLGELLAAEGTALDAIYCCPHYKDGSVPEFAVRCTCRKPLPGMLHDAARDHGLSLPDSVFIGDAVRDLRAGRAAGSHTILVLTGNGSDSLKVATPDLIDHTADDLESAALWLRGVSGF